jgi:kynurenine formamidase
MITFPRITPPTLLIYETWEEFAERIGAAKFGATWLTASYLVIQSDHVGTHMDAVKHLRGPDSPGPESIPIDYCFSDGVVLDFRHKEFGAGISTAEIQEALDKIGYELKKRTLSSFRQVHRHTTANSAT